MPWPNHSANRPSGQRLPRKATKLHKPNTVNAHEPIDIGDQYLKMGACRIDNEEIHDGLRSQKLYLADESHGSYWSPARRRNATIIPSAATMAAPMLQKLDQATLRLGSLGLAGKPYVSGLSTSK